MINVSSYVLRFPFKLQHPRPHSHHKCSFNLASLLCSFLSLLFQQHNCPYHSPGRIKPGLRLCPLDERSPRQYTGMFVTASGWSSIVQWGWTRTKLWIVPHPLAVMPTAKPLNSRQPTLSSVSGDSKHCLRDVAWGEIVQLDSSCPSLSLFVHTP